MGAKVSRLLDLSRQWSRWADQYDRDAKASRNPLIATQMRAWAQAYRNAGALLALTVRPSAPVRRPRR